LEKKSGHVMYMTLMDRDDGKATTKEGRSGNTSPRVEWSSDVSR